MHISKQSPEPANVITPNERQSAEQSFDEQWLAGREELLKFEPGKTHLTRSSVLGKLREATTLEELTANTKKLLGYMRDEKLAIDRSHASPADKKLAHGECKIFGKAIHAFHSDVYSAKGVPNPIDRTKRFEDMTGFDPGKVRVRGA